MTPEEHAGRQQRLSRGKREVEEERLPLGVYPNAVVIAFQIEDVRCEQADSPAPILKHHQETAEIGYKMNALKRSIDTKGRLLSDSG